MDLTPDQQALRRERNETKKELFLTYLLEWARGLMHTEEHHARMEQFRKDMFQFVLDETRETHDLYFSEKGYLAVPKGTAVIELDPDDFERPRGFPRKEQP